MLKMKNLHTKGVDVRTLPVFTKNQNTAHDRARNYACEKHRLTHRGERCGRRQLHAAIKRSIFVVKWRWIWAWTLRLTIYCLPAGIMPRHQTLVPGAPGGALFDALVLDSESRGIETGRRRQCDIYNLK